MLPRLSAVTFLVFCFSSLQSQTASPNLQLLGHLAYDTATLAGCWHHVDSSGREYALVGTSKGLSIVDLSNPAQPFQLFKVPGLTNNWRELKTWAGFAYVGSEALNSGITIVDLRELPDTVTWKTYHGDGQYDGQILKSHALATSNGYLYIFGGSTLADGAIICSLSDPWNPQVVGWYDQNYIHDGYIRNDTLWAGEIYEGRFSVIDVSDKAVPEILATQPTPGAFNHNTWLSDDGRTLFTTDEKLNAPLAAFDISDLDNITLLDRYKCSPTPMAEVHNVRVHNGFLINPSYAGQLTIVDAHKPDNLIETAWAVLGTSLVWDADPYLPSGIVIATAKNEGLFVYKPTYKRAAYLEGIVYDAVTNLPLNNAKIFIEGTPNADTSRIDGRYKTGVAQTGSYNVIVQHNGYQSVTFPNITLTAAVTTELDIHLDPVMVSFKSPAPDPGISVAPTLFHSQVTVHVPPSSLYLDDNAQILIFDLSGNLYLKTPLEGAVTRLDIGSEMPPGNYVLIVQNGRNFSPAVRIVKQ